jgi:predicted CoA-binding protein
VADPADVLRQAHTVLVIDWPTREVPDSLREAGYEVVIKGGADAEVPVDAVDLVYAYRPLDELEGIVSTAEELGASAVWREPADDADESSRAREIVEDAGLEYVDEVSIVDAVRGL